MLSFFFVQHIERELPYGCMLNCAGGRKKTYEVLAVLRGTSLIIDIITFEQRNALPLQQCRPGLFFFFKGILLHTSSITQT